eukprot:COSAG01_NODE_1795_length_9213_cov_3.564297_2_plen_372_part_00
MSSFTVGQQPPQQPPGRRAVRSQPAAATQSSPISRAPGAAHTIISPTVQQRRQLVRAQRRGERVEMELAARRQQRLEEVRRRPVAGTAAGTGEVLGGSDGRAAVQQQPHGPGTGEGARQARLRYFARQQAERGRVRRGPSVRPAEAEGAAAAAAVAAAAAQAWQQHEASTQQQVDGWGVAPSAADQSTALTPLVRALMDQLAARLGGDDDARHRAVVQRCVRMLCVVLQNAATKARHEPKMARLRARNHKLWAGLLQHPEMEAVLAMAGWRVLQSSEQPEPEPEPESKQEPEPEPAPEPEPESKQEPEPDLAVACSTPPPSEAPSAPPVEAEDSVAAARRRDVELVHTGALEGDVGLLVAVLHAAQGWLVA